MAISSFRDFPSVASDLSVVSKGTVLRSEKFKIMIIENSEINFGLVLKLLSAFL